jgi:class 3 adenylate cyclase/tetratricopeptide (TPR) repeat protein
VERKLATALFADLVDSTGLGEQDPERTRILLERFYDVLAVEIELAGGTLEKFAGDAVMAVFGAPAAQEDHAERALHAALSLQRRIAETFGGSLQVRVGVCSGDVVVGEPRAGSSFVTGDAVNVAARLEQAAEPAEILAGERTVTLARGAFEFGPPRTIEAKGKAEPVACRAAVRALTLMRPRGVSGLATAFVGRDSELELLRATYRRAVELETPHLVTIYGEAGVGKTRLVRELWQWLAEQQPEPRRRTGRCLAYGHAAYWALGEILKEDLGIRESDSEERVAELLGAHAALGLALGRGASPETSPVDVRERLHDAAVSFFDRLASDRPAVVLIEDLHWAEDPLLDLVERVLRDARGPQLFIATTRPELGDGRPAWGAGRRNVATVWLEPLADADAGRLVAELPAALGDLVVARADGNPFFVEELVSSFVDRGVLRREGGGWGVADEIDAASLPDTVQALLAARIDLLDPAAKEALQAAAVIGRAFWRVPLRELLGVEPPLAPLEDRDFVRRRSGSSMEGDVEYVFRHALTREVAYGSLPKAKRARLHARVAGWLEETGGGRDEHAPLLAHHYAEAARPEDADLAWAGDPDTAESLRRRAIDWLRRAGELAVSRYELEDGVALLERAAELEQDREALALLWRLVGRAQAFRYDGRAFTQAMERSLELTGHAAARAETLAELAYQTSFRAGMFMNLPASEAFEGWIDDVLGTHGVPASTHAKALIARSFWRNDDTLSEALEATRIAASQDDPALRSTAARARGYALFKAGDFTGAYEATLESVELLRDVEDREEAVEAHEQLATAAVALARVDEARRLVAITDELVQPLSSHHRVHGISLRLESESLFGDWEAIRAELGRTERLIEANLATPCGRHAMAYYIQALAHEQANDPEEARRLERTAEVRRGDAVGPNVGVRRALLALARGEIDAATAEVRDPAAALPVHGWWWFALPVPMAYLDIHGVAGNRDEVERVGAHVLERGVPILQPFALRALGRVRGDAGLVREAAARFESMGLSSRARETEALL